MNKRTLMIATAVAALTAGTAFAQAPGESNHMNPASRNAPAEKVAPNAGAGPHGSAGEQRSTPSNRMGQAPGSDRSTTGQAPTEQPNAQRQTPNERNNARSNERSNERANERNRSTTGQGTSDKDRMEHRGANENRTNRSNERDRSTTGQGTDKGPMENRGANENRSGTSTTTTGGTRGAVNLSSEQRTRIHGIIVGDRGAPRVGHVDFAVNVGTRVPRTIHLAPVPQDIVVIEPSWRGFEYFLVGDEIVVVDPASMEIVAVLPA